VTEAAASIKGASAAAGARSIEQAAAGGINYLPHGAGSRMAGTSLFAASGQYLAVGTDAASKATYLGSRRAMEATMAGKGIVTRTAAAVMDGVATAGRGLKSGMARIGSSAMSGLRLASRAFWPLLIADMGLELVKAPIGDFVAQNTQFKRAGAKIKEDFFGGMFALLQSAKIGTDAWVGREATMQVGSAKISTMALAKLGITNATFDKLEAPVGTIEHAQGTQEAATQLSQTLGQQAGETVQDWWVRVRDALPTELSKQIKQILSKPGSMTQVGTTQLYGQNTPIYDLTPEARAQIQQLMGGAVTGQVTQLTEDTKNEYVTALTAALKAQGLTTGQIAGLSTEQLTVLGRLVEGDAEGKYSALVGYVASTFTGAIQKSGKQISASKDVQSTLDTVKETLGKDWVKQMNSVLTGAPKGKHEKEVARLLAKALGSDWQDRIRQASQALVGSPTARQTPTEQLASGLAESRKNVEAAIRDYLKNIPLDYQRAVNEIIAKGKELDPGIVRKLKKKFGDDWLAGMRAGTDAIGSGPKDQAVRQALKKAFGTNWRQVLQQAGTLAFERAGGADSEMLAKALRKTLRAAVDQLTPKDLGTSGRSETRKTKAAIKKELADPVVQAALEAATGPDAKKAKKGLSDLGQAFKDTIPDAAARERFVATLVALQKAGTAPNIDDMTKFLDQAIPNAASAIVTLADGVQTLTNRVKTFLSTVGQPSGGGGSGRRGSVTVPHQARRGASGLMFDTNGQTDLTVGEAGKESVMVLRNFRHMRLNTTPVRKMVESVAAGVGGALPRPNVSRMLHAGPLAGEGMGRRVEVRADKLQLFTDQQRRSVDAQLEFLAPSGR